MEELSTITDKTFHNISHKSRYFGFTNKRLDRSLLYNVPLSHIDDSQPFNVISDFMVSVLASNVENRSL